MQKYTHLIFLDGSVFTKMIRLFCFIRIFLSEFAKTFLNLFIFFKDFIDLFLERGEGREIERERNINGWLPLVHPPLRTQPATQTCVLTGNRTGEPLVRRPALYPLSHTSQGTFLNLFKSHSQQELVTKKYFLLILHSELTGSLYESLLRNKIKF